MSPVRSHFARQAEACERLGSPFTARLCRILPDLLDDGTATGRRISSWPGDPRADALALRLCGGLHHVVLSHADDGLAAVYPPAATDDDALGAALRSAISRNDERLSRFIAGAPQTNEVARSGMLLPGFLTVARETGLPLAIHEIGASAGLNLLFDRFHYSYGAAQWGDAASPARLAPEVRGAAPPLAGNLTVTTRDGCDVSPVDVRDPAARLRLRSYLWPDQPLRMERQRGALQIAQVERPRLEAMDAARFLRTRLDERKTGEAFVLFHSIMWQYMPSASQDEIERTLGEAGRTADGSSPVAWLRMEPLDTRDPHATLSLTLWPGGETRRLARCDYHGRWIEWTGPGG